MNIIKMIDKFNNSPKGRLLKSVFILMFSIIIAITAVYAWLANNSNVYSGGLGVGPDPDSGFIYFSPYYVYDIDTHTIARGNQVDTTTFRNLTIDLRPYDTMFTSTNDYTPVVLRALAVDLDASLIPTGNGTKTMTIEIARNPALDNGTSSTLDDIFSSVGHVGCYTASALSFDATNATIYDTIVAQYRLDNSQGKFTTVTNNVITKTNSISFNVSYSANDYKVFNTTHHAVAVYLVFDYNPALAQLFATQYMNELNNLGSSLNQGYPISNDLTKISITFQNS